MSKRKAEEALERIAATLSVGEWDGSVSNQIADILHQAGVEIPAPDPNLLPPASCPQCGNRDRLRVTESYAASHRYDAHTHVAHERLPDHDDANEDYAGYCQSCDHVGPLEAFGMKLLDWVDDDDEDDNEEDDDGEA
jgi:hypothetical protein